MAENSFERLHVLQPLSCHITHHLHARCVASLIVLAKRHGSMQMQDDAKVK